MKFILEIGGGGIRGVIPAEICAELEAYIHKPIYQVFDLISGTSTGAILGSQLASGISASVCRDLYVKKGASVFQSRPWWNPVNWFKEKYDRKYIINEMSESFLKSPLKTKNPIMNQLLTKFVCTSVSIIDERTHFFKSWEPEDGKLDTITAVARSFAAAYYFGAINDPVNKQVWVDGGEGVDNCTIRHCIIESMLQDWIHEGVYILSLGCGYVKPGRPYSEASKMGWVKESMFYVNLARRQSTDDQLFEAKQISSKLGKNLIVDRLDVEIPQDWNKLDAIEHIKDFSSLVLKSLPMQISDVVTRIKTLKP